MLLSEGAKVFTEGYEGYPSWFVNTFGWGMAILLVVVSFILSRLKWKNERTSILKKKENKDDRYCTYNDDCVAFDYLGRLDLCFN